MKRRGAALRRRGEEFVVALHLWSGKILIGVVGCERRRCEQPTRQLHAGDHDAAIEFGHQIIGLNDRWRERIGRAGAHIAAAFGSLLPGRYCHARFILKFALHALLVARRRKRQLQIGALGGLAGVPEAVHHGWGQRQQTAPRRGPFQHLDREAEASPSFVDGPDVLDAGDRARRVMVLQSLADAGQRVMHLDIQ